MYELKPCPFCGGEAKSGACIDDYNNHGVYCTNDDCGCMFSHYSFKTVADAEAAWNKRN